MFSLVHKKSFKRIIVIILLSIITIIVFIFIWIFLQIRALPQVNPQALNTYAPTRILADNNQVIWQPTNQHVKPLKYQEIPDLYAKSLVQTEDANYWKDKGYSNKGIINMVYTTIGSKFNHNIIARGGSTIEQQLIKNVFFDGTNQIKTTTRKVQEIYLAQQLDHNFNKQQILNYYINNLNFNENDKGIGAVMMTYFGKQPSDYHNRNISNIAQQAYLAGLGQNPTLYDLYVHPKAGNMRKNVILGIMRNHHFITNEEYQKAINYNLTHDLKPRFWESELQQKRNLKYKAYTDAVIGNVMKMGYNLNDVSLQIHTYLNPTKYNQITNLVRQNKYYQDGNVGKEQVGATVINKNGIVEGIVGSRHSKDEYNRALQTDRSSGSSLKPFTAYGPLFQYLGNQYNTSSMFNSAPYLYPGTNRYMHNFGNANYGAIDAQKALRLSVNTVVARIDDDILGSTRMKSFLNATGLDVKSHYSAVDGIGLNISTLQAASAWNSINNGGIYTKPRFVKSLIFPDGSKKEIKPQRHRAMNASTAYVLSQMLRGVLAQGYTGYQGSIHNYNGYAAKTGTVELPDGSKARNVYGEGGIDSWFDSITNDGAAISLWFGYNHPNNSPQVSDNFFGGQHLGRDLQLLMNKNRHYINDWEQPSHVQVLNGSGLNTNYAITDAKDIDNIKDTNVSSINNIYNQLGTLNNIQPQTKIANNWDEQIPNKEKPFYHIYQKNNDILQNNNVLNSNTFDSLINQKKR